MYPLKYYQLRISNADMIPILIIDLNVFTCFTYLFLLSWWCFERHIHFICNTCFRGAQKYCWYFLFAYWIILCRKCRTFCVLKHQMYVLPTHITRIMGPTWGPLGSCRSQVAPYRPHEPCSHGTHSLTESILLFILIFTMLMRLLGGYMGMLYRGNNYRID